MRFIAWLITLAENSDRIAEAAADRLRAKLGGHTDMVVRIVHFLLITAGISSPLLMYFAGAPLPGVHSGLHRVFHLSYSILHFP